MTVSKGGWRQSGHHIETIRQPKTSGHDLIVGSDERRVARTWAGIGVNRRLFETCIGAHIQTEQGHQRPAQTMSTNRYRGHGEPERKPRQCAHELWRADSRGHAKRLVHVGETHFGFTGTRKEWANNQREIRIL